MSEEITLEPWEVQARGIVSRAAPPLALCLQFLGTLVFRTLVSMPAGLLLAWCIQQIQPGVSVWPAALAIAASMAVKPAFDSCWVLRQRMRVGERAAERASMAQSKQRERSNHLEHPRLG